MDVLVTNTTLAGRTGTEIVVRDLALGLARRGHRVTVFSPHHGPICREISAGGVQVVRSLREVRVPPDVVHGHHHAVTVEALLAFPSVPALFVCHDRLASIDVPPLHPRVLLWVSVDANTAGRLEAYGIPAERHTTVLNAVDLERFRPRQPLRRRPARALVFSNAAGSVFSIEPLRAACASRGIALDVAGAGSGSTCAAPEELLPRYDLVFAKARMALEAAAVGCAVVLCDYRGLGEMVTPAAFGRMREWNFGMRLLTRPIEVGAVGAEIDRFDADGVAEVRDRVRAEAGLERTLDRWEELYRGLVATTLPSVDLLEEHRGYLHRQLEAALTVRDHPPEYAMERLEKGVLAALELRLRAAPGIVLAGQRFPVSVSLVNRGAGWIASEAPFPVHLSYHWFDAETGGVELWDGIRTGFRPAVGMDQRRDVRMEVEAPARPGRWRLRVALVQEAIGWLDGPAPHLGFDLTVDVRGVLRDDTRHVAGSDAAATDTPARGNGSQLSRKGS